MKQDPMSQAKILENQLMAALLAAGRFKRAKQVKEYGLLCAQAGALRATQLLLKVRAEKHNSYPENWPRCIACGDYALDGEITCGRTSCNVYLVGIQAKRFGIKEMKINEKKRK